MFDHLVQQAIVLRQAGRPQDAERLYRAVLRAQPNHPNANHQLTELLELTPHYAANLLVLKATLEANPNQSQCWLNYINALIHTGHPYAALGVLQTARERGIQGLQGETADALVLRLQAPITGQPTAHEIDSIVTLYDAGHYRELLSAAHTMTQSFPLFGFAWKVLGAALKQSGRSVEALAPMHMAVALTPDDAEAHSNLGNTLQSLGRLEEAVAHYRRALEIKADFVEVHNNLGNALQGLGQLEEAVACYRRALTLKPDYAAAYNNLGNALQCIGQLEDAVAIHRQALEIEPDLVEVRFNLALAAKIKPGDDNMAALIDYEASLRNGTTPRLEADQEIPLHFALGKCYDDVGEHDKAFPHFLKGSRLKRGTFNYNPAQTARYIATIQRNFDSAALKRLRGAGDSSRLPIFVLGMPRSGTTLIAQIISSHPHAFNAGELPDLMEIAQRPHAGANLLENLDLFDQTQLAVLGEEYVQSLQRHAPDMRRIIDKMPQNFLAVGLIHLMLPNAKIIHVQRDPVDTCLSCFTQLFTIGQEHSYNLAELGRYYLEYFHLMQYWRETLPHGAFLDVQYEDVVSDQAAQSRRILEYCGLEWHDACGEPHKNKRAVLTASRVQVRQPVYQSSVERWRNYERHLGPLLEALGDLVQHTAEH